MWAEAGYEVAWAQFALPEVELVAAAPAAAGSQAPIRCRQVGTELEVSGNDFRLTFDTVFGMWRTLEYAGVPLLVGGPRLNFWRAPNDNDRRKFEAEWRKARLHQFTQRIDQVDWAELPGSAVRIEVLARLAPPVLDIAYECRYIYTIWGSGDILLETQGRPQGKLPVLPRIGLELTVPGALNRAIWYGRGPGESYPDSKLANRVSVYERPVAELHTPYIYPQDNGNRTEVRWAALVNGTGVGLLACGRPLLDFSAHYYTTEDLTAATHTYELKWRDDITLHLDYRHCGLGSGSCGPAPWPQYLLQPEEFSFAVRLRPFTLAACSPAELAREVLPAL